MKFGILFIILQFLRESQYFGVKFIRSTTASCNSANNLLNLVHANEEKKTHIFYYIAQNIFSTNYIENTAPIYENNLKLADPVPKGVPNVPNKNSD